MRFDHHVPIIDRKLPVRYNFTHLNQLYLEYEDVEWRGKFYSLLVIESDYDEFFIKKQLSVIKREYYDSDIFTRKEMNPDEQL